MAIQTLGLSYDGPKWTVNQLIKSPTFVPNTIMKMVKDANIADWLLREGPTASGGSVAFEETVALYASTEGEIVAEFGEYPGTQGSVSTPGVRSTTKKGVHFKISEEMRTRNDTGRVADEMRKVRDTLVNGRDKAFINALMANTNVTQQFTPGTQWNSASTTIISDIAKAMYSISSVPVAGPAQYAETLNYTADTLVIHPSYTPYFIDNASINSIFAGSPLADQQLRYTGKLPKKFMTLDVLTSFRCPTDRAIVCQRGAMGFISTEWPLAASPLKRDEDTDSYRTNFRYRDVMVVDNPKAVVYIMGIDKITGVGD
jgi:hypothetical protein